MNRVRLNFCAFVMVAAIRLAANAAEPGHATVDGIQKPAADDPDGFRVIWDREPADSPFSQGSWVAMTYGSAIRGFSPDNVHMYGAHASIGYYVMDNVSMNFEATSYYGTHLASPGVANEGVFYGGSVESILRCDLIHYGKWSAYVEGGIGFSELSKSVPTGGTNYNFVLTAGFGLSKSLGESCSLMAGCRWFHLSNGAFFTSKNPGFDSLMVYSGFLFK
jgi:Lipid A 3-O-deacylase (PagL)